MQIPSSAFTFGLVSRDMRFLSFVDSATDFRVERIEAGIAIIGLISGGGIIFTVGEGSRFTDRSIVLFRFLMGNNYSFENDACDFCNFFLKVFRLGSAHFL